MTHRDGFPWFSARRAGRGDAGHRKTAAPSKGLATSQSHGKPPSRSRPLIPGGRQEALTMLRRTRGFPATRPIARRTACTISMGHYQRSA